MDPEDLDLLELQDQAQEVGFLTPREYARLRHFTPQNIYYHIRNKHIEVVTCQCGRRIISVTEADKFFNLTHNETFG